MSQPALPPAVTIAPRAAGSDRASDFDFELPPALIARQPLAERSASRLLDGRSDPPADRVFRELPALLRAGDLLVFNDTQVVKARLHGRKASGGAVALLVERLLEAPDEAWVHLRASRSPTAGARLSLAGGALRAEVLGRVGAQGSLFHLRFDQALLAALQAHGEVPLPPYIEAARAQDGAAAPPVDDAARYQTVFARAPGAVAAPTASLHFDDATLAALAAQGVASTRLTLHVGAGTFQPVRGDDLDAHPMHHERYELPPAAAQAIVEARRRGGRVVACGTTVLRALESAALSAEGFDVVADPQAWRGPPNAAVPPANAVIGGLACGARETALFIRPGHRFRSADLLITNFHLPRSTLLMLVAAFAGHDRVRALYRHAIEHGYRFYSYGDAMLLARA